MNALGVAMDARALVAKGWTQPRSDRAEDFCSARLEDGTPCNVLNPAAVKFTLGGALLKATNHSGEGRERHPAALAVYAKLKAHLKTDPGEWSNQPMRWGREVIGALDAVIEQLRAEGTHGA